MDQYVYYFVYSFADRNGSGTGSGEHHSAQPFRTATEIQDLAEKTRKDNRFTAVTITNVIQLSGPSVQGAAVR